jgi:hypothetical protein
MGSDHYPHVVLVDSGHAQHLATGLIDPTKTELYVRPPAEGFGPLRVSRYELDPSALKPSLMKLVQ